jgi:hypothetical protein
LRFLSVVLFGVFCAQGAWGGGVCLLESSVPQYDLRSFMDVLEDEGRSMTVDDVASPALAGRFGPPPRGHFNFGFTSSALWFRFTLAPATTNPDHGTRPELWILDPGWNFFDTFHLYVPRPEAEGGWHVYGAGRLLFSPGGPENRHFQLPPDLPAPATCYIRVTGIRPIMMAPTIATLDGTLRANGFKTLGTALLIGFFATLMLGNLAVYLYTGNSKYKWFVLSNLTFVSFVATTSYQHFFAVKNLPTVIMVVGLLGQAILATTFRTFFEIRRNNRKLNAILWPRWVVSRRGRRARRARGRPAEVSIRDRLYACRVPGQLRRPQSAKDDHLIFLASWLVRPCPRSSQLGHQRGAFPLCFPNSWGCPCGSRPCALPSCWPTASSHFGAAPGRRGSMAKAGPPSWQA